MSEYWVSKKKYFCKYCEIYIADDAPSRQHHENGMRHKGNMERFIRGLYKAGEKRQKDLEEEKRDMARVEQAAQAAFAQDVGAGLAKPTPSASSTAPAARKPLPKPTNPFSNYSTAESLGYQDPDMERIAREAERRRTQGVVGDWETITSTPHPIPDPASPSIPGAVVGTFVLKREADIAIDEEDNRQFKLRKKTLGSGLGGIYDPGIIPIKLKKQEESPTNSSDAVGDTLQPTDTPKWTKVQWKRLGENVKQDGETSADLFGGGGDGEQTGGDPEEQQPKIEGEEQSSPARLPNKKEGEMKLEDSVPAPASETGGNLFRKRKIPASASRGNQV